ncbi:MAG: hypothetical protein DHS20C14_16320 [Phycisphaeraceae bacterium]|nr:MAG: hypothetical protein DHS20C14_16320 [Phycisphaeraceae bacterium]
MRKLAEMVGDLVEGDPKILIGIGVVIVVVVGCAIYAKATKARRLRAQAKFVRRRD